ncbi:MAG: SGNH/GDSL hydrolase family protein [Pyrinomonadaceae bacterium]
MSAGNLRNGSSISRNWSRKKRIAITLLTVAGGVVVGLLLVEVGLRIVGFRYLNLSQEDQYVGYALRPGAEGWWTREGKAYIKINSDGLRDREHSELKPPNTLRIAILGDSYTEALQVPGEKAFWAVMEQRLQGCQTLAGRRVEAINFGVSGFSTARELITLRRRVWKYSPDIIVLVITISNDITDNSPVLSQYANAPLPYFVYRNGALVLDDSRLRARDKSFKSHLQKSALGQSLNWLRSHLRLMDLIDKSRAAFQNVELRQKKSVTRIGHEPGIAANVFRQPNDPAWDEAWRVTEGLILLMGDEVKANRAQFLLVTGSTGIQVHPDPKVGEDFMRRLGVNDLFYPDYRIKALGDREGIEVLTLAPALQKLAEQKHAFLHGTDGTGHWNEWGHREVGQRIAEKLCEVARH